MYTFSSKGVRITVFADKELEHLNKVKMLYLITILRA